MRRLGQSQRRRRSRVCCSSSESPGLDSRCKFINRSCCCCRCCCLARLVMSSTRITHTIVDISHMQKRGSTCFHSPEQMSRSEFGTVQLHLVQDYLLFRILNNTGSRKMVLLTQTSLPHIFCLQSFWTINLISVYYLAVTLQLVTKLHEMQNLFVFQQSHS